MPVVRPFGECVARPAEGERQFPLPRHLETVASGVGNFQGQPAERLDYLAGWMHDIGKSNEKWQWYIESPRSRKGPPHSVYGAILYVYYAERLLNIWKMPRREKTELRRRVQWWCRDLLDHHGRLGDIEETEVPWRSFPPQWEHFDLPGIHDAVSRLFPEVAGAAPTVGSLKAWHKGFVDTWAKWYMDWTGQAVLAEYEEAEAPVSCLRLSTASLIRADRFDAAQIEPRRLQREELEGALAHLEKFLEDKGRQSAGSTPAGGGLTGVTALRQRVHQQAVERYRQNPKGDLYVLKLPTGLGKTLTALRVALEIAGDRGKERIVYVAPYLTILSQAAGEIAKASGLEVMEHHSLSMTEDREWDDKAILLLESWQSPVVATTFNQMFRAFFAQRAQETLRLAGLANSVVIVDEPQIVDDSVWQPFLAMIQGAAREMNATFLFVTATLPPLRPGLKESPIPLAPADIRYPDRYRARVVVEPWDEKQLADHLVGRERDTRHLAVILNTIGDAARVYQELSERLKDAGPADSEPRILHLHGLMTPLHKRLRIEEMKECLGAGQRLWAVTTQIIEAGVDVSFQKVYRARPIYSSVIQAAGRVNRHGSEGELGEIVVFSFLRGGEQDSRVWVYRDAIVREETDRSLGKAAEWMEHELYEEVDQYFSRCSARTNSAAKMQALAQAAQGRWSAVSGWSPFEEDPRRVSIFVPWGEEYLERPIGLDIRRRMNEFGIRGVREIYERYLDRVWMGGLSFVARKRFMALMQQFIVSLPPKMALKVAANLADDVEIKLAADTPKYQEDRGYADLAAGWVEDCIL
ncbi:hypothetical protein CVV65_13670 [Kyrpidia spormannii]|uniref:CRISPR-associated helicase/endonuclease Cas3 n=1 Tax=Kyrpidia spormannii TaxID=2055160 RepID=A0A2K8N917_9BACL|nr:hypothetical protein CVV65_13670 [Kyrpidia spormannii]